MKEIRRKLKAESEKSELPENSFGLSALSSPLRIGYDGKRAANNVTGLGNYSRSLIEHLATQFPANQYYVYTPKITEALKKHQLFLKDNVKLELPPKNSTSPIWRSVGVVLELIRNKVALYHGLNHEIPYGLKENGIKSIVTIHDLIFLVKPRYYKFFDRFIYKYKSRYACKHADRIIAISEQTKRDIIYFYKIDPAKIDVVYQSCDNQFKNLLGENEREFIRNKYKLPQNYLLNVGTVEERKNLLVIIEALPYIDSSYPLVVIGKETPYLKIIKKKIEALDLQKRVIFLKNIPFSDLPGIYQMASTFIYPSKYEGFGIPIIEALYGKVPVVAATGSCLEEAGGPGSRYITPTDSSALADAINTIIKSKEVSSLMAEEGLKYVQRFNADVVTKQMMDCYLKTLNE
ncbi:glycosyltransferase family 4 protein [Pedobacter insulae]|uniref:Glycosyltransferase involved in cell wall bisynthesis n=1 Tax=Pedobacter insulae TaxID=414048 RepID=A0A1I2Y0X6_9SPHI|nr:glycosyltransferase family 1 protein [Pedobacter insulae]SFH17981.1 Glycosyltransferase involved in cell wall bisynthesis [Pedobacter insulae]